MATVKDQRSRLPRGATAANASAEPARTSVNACAAADDSPSERPSATADQPLLSTEEAKVESNSG